ncbi:MAG TPA: hypothetical protein VJV23_12415 [Candidatus Polarisedimenticolia bacterium]|nr:hypothetical protein [Candidatus Polarisedimenticolia bacterium]
MIDLLVHVAIGILAPAGPAGRRSAGAPAVRRAGAALAAILTLLAAVTVAGAAEEPPAAEEEPRAPDDGASRVPS